MTENCQSISAAKTMSCEHMERLRNSFIKNESNINYINKLVDLYNINSSEQLLLTDSEKHALTSALFYKNFIEHSQSWYLVYTMEIAWIVLISIAAVIDSIDLEYLVMIITISATWYLISQQDSMAEKHLNRTMKNIAKDKLQENKYTTELLEKLQANYSQTT